MPREEKQLLFKDICARLPYFPMVHWRNADVILTPVMLGLYVNEECKPYLRPMSSMTEEERNNLQSLHDIINNENYGDGYSPAIWEAISEWVDYCNSRHLDYHGLISMGLALEAPEGMYKTE